MQCRLGDVLPISALTQIAGILSVDTLNRVRHSSGPLVREVEEDIGVTPLEFVKLTKLEFEDGSERTAELHLYRVTAWAAYLPYRMMKTAAKMQVAGAGALGSPDQRNVTHAGA
jgi:hypothetical protein